MPPTKTSSADARLILHIGPPKTAVTSLQRALQSAPHDLYHYAGNRYPRDAADRGLPWSLNEVARGSVRRQTAEGEDLLNSIRNVLATGQHLVVSQEMILVRQPGISFQSKIDRIGRFLADIPVTVLLTYRDPESGLRSYYQEIFQNLPIVQKLSFRRFCRDERIQIFDYADLLERLSKSGLHDVRILDFRKLIQGRGTYRDVFGAAAGALKDTPLSWGHVDGRDWDSTKRPLPAVSARSLSSLPFVPLKVIRLLPGFATLRGLLDRITLRPATTEDLKVPAKLRKRLEAGARTAEAILEAQETAMHRGGR